MNSRPLVLSLLIFHIKKPIVQTLKDYKTL